MDMAWWARQVESRIAKWKGADDVRPDLCRHGVSSRLGVRARVKRKRRRVESRMKVRVRVRKDERMRRGWWRRRRRVRLMRRGLRRDEWGGGWRDGSSVEW